MAGRGVTGTEAVLCIALQISIKKTAIVHIKQWQWGGGGGGVTAHFTTVSGILKYSDVRFSINVYDYEKLH